MGQQPRTYVKARPGETPGARDEDAGWNTT